ncbi:hypothetical protein VPH35_004161 [Triticum aestivum]
MEAMAAKLVFPQDNPPLSIISAAKIAVVPITTDPCLPSGSVPTLHFGSGDFIHGVNTVLRYIAVLHLSPASMARTLFRKHVLMNGSSTHHSFFQALNLKPLAHFLMDTWHLEPFWLVMV